MSARRVGHGIAANAVAFGSTVGAQLLSVPVLVHFWGLSQFGIWVILSTIPTYLILSNFGLSIVASNDMAALITAGERARARAIYSTAVVSIAALSAVILVAGIAIAALVPPGAMPASQHVGPGEMRAAIIGIVVYGVLAINTDAAMALYRATGAYARGTAVGTAVVLGERLAVLAGAPFGLAGAAIAMAGLRLIGLVYMFADAGRANPDMRPRLREASLAEARRMAVLGFGMILFTVAMAIDLQGPIVILGAVVPPAAVGLFSATRTLTRFSLQATTMVSTSVMAEFAIASGDEANPRRAKLFAFNLVAGGMLLAGCLAFLLLFGQSLTHLWLLGKARPDFALLALLAVGTTLQGLWQITGNLLLASNSQYSFTPVFLLISAVMAGAAVAVAPHWGLTGVAGVLCGAELLICLWVYRQAARQNIGRVGEAPGIAAAMAREWIARRRAARSGR